jgi:hypothetical protein
MKITAEIRSQAPALLAIALIIVLTFTPGAGVKAVLNSAAHPSEYQQFVQNYTNSSRGNWTSVGKPMFPVFFNDSQIAIGSNWSIVEPLVAGQNYHVYCYGAWVNNGSTPKTDYDIYVYDPKGKLESEHTEAAGLPEHLGTRVNDTFFTPALSGNYTFVILNHAGESKGAQSATFMAIENVQPNQWVTKYIEGKRPDGTATYYTSWAYEFATNSPRIELYIRVPNTLDMYEARLYVMSNANSSIVNNAPLPWEPGLYGNLSDGVGGYSLDSEQYRGVAYASCEYKGQDMYLNYSSNSTAVSLNQTLYHLVLIGEAGSGNLDFLVKTQFGNTGLLTANSTGNPTQVVAGKETNITYLSKSTDLEIAFLEYTINNWTSSTDISMQINNRTCSAVIPSQEPGTFLQYLVTANDTLENTFSDTGNYFVKQLPTLNITVLDENIWVGKNLTIEGTLLGVSQSSSVDLQFMSANQTLDFQVMTSENGSFIFSNHFNNTGTWSLQSSFSGDSFAYPCYGNQLLIHIQEPPFIVKNGIFIGGGGFFGVVGLALFYYIKKRRQ